MIDDIVEDPEEQRHEPSRLEKSLVYGTAGTILAGVLAMAGYLAVEQYNWKQPRTEECHLHYFSFETQGREAIEDEVARQHESMPEGLTEYFPAEYLNPEPQSPDISGWMELRQYYPRDHCYIKQGLHEDDVIY